MKSLALPVPRQITIKRVLLAVAQIIEPAFMHVDRACVRYWTYWEMFRLEEEDQDDDDEEE